jgi:hypothetical protein
MEQSGEAIREPVVERDQSRGKLEEPFRKETIISRWASFERQDSGIPSSP